MVYNGKIISIYTGLERVKSACKKPEVDQTVHLYPFRDLLYTYKAAAENSVPQLSNK